RFASTSAEDLAALVLGPVDARRQDADRDRLVVGVPADLRDLDLLDRRLLDPVAKTERPVSLDPEPVNLKQRVGLERARLLPPLRRPGRLESHERVPNPSLELLPRVVRMAVLEIAPSRCELRVDDGRELRAGFDPSARLELRRGQSPLLGADDLGDLPLDASA